MAGPVAHSLAGALVYCGACAVRNRRPRITDPLLAGCVLAANLPDLDFLPGLIAGNRERFHRGFSHSLGFPLAVTAFAFLALRVRVGVRRLALTGLLGLATATHLLIDWATWDASQPAGIPLLWPNDDHYMAAHPWFLNVERRQWWRAEVMTHNLRGVLREALILGPPVLWLWAWGRAGPCRRGHPSRRSRSSPARSRSE